MAKNHVGPIAELGTTIARLAGKEAEATVVAGSERIARASVGEVASWLKGAEERLDTRVDEQTRTQIMEQMGYNCSKMNRDHVERMLAKRNRFETLEAFLEAEEEKPTPGTRLVREGDVVYQFYEPLTAFGRRCFCFL